MKKIGAIIIVLISMLSLATCKNNSQEESIKSKIAKAKKHLLELEAQYNNTVNNKKSDGKTVKVKTQKISKEKVEHTIQASGIADARQIAYISPEIGGLIKNIYVKEGQYVKKGELLVALNSKVLQNSKVELEKNLELAKIIFEKQKILKDKEVGKEIDYIKAKNQKESLEAKLKTLNSQIETTRILAPFSGVINKINAKQGEMASPAAPLIQILNLSKIKITADIAEKYIAVIKKNEKVLITFSAYPDLKINTKINRIGDVIDPINRTFEIEVNVNNADKKIKPNMICELHITDYTGNEILIPAGIIKNDRKGQFVYIAKEQNKTTIATKKYIKTGFSIASKIVAKEGLAEGDNLIIQGANMVNNGIKLEIIN